MKDVVKNWTSYAEKIEAILDEALPLANSQPKVIHEAMRYSTLGGGKRLRALLAMAACVAVGGQAEQAAGLSAALEMVHAYSLIHDDLPSMDDDDLRRGKPANHIVYGEGMAVLAGDALLTEAFAELANMPEKYGVSEKVTLRIIAEFAQGIGSRGMVGGQVVDILAQDQDLSAETLEYIHRHKTGALFIVALRGGALIGGASEAELAKITRYGEHFGYAFQIQDDILDEIGESEQLGKAVGSDELLGKQTYPRLYGLEKSQEMAQNHVQECLEAISDFSSKGMALKELATFIIQRDH